MDQYDSSSQIVSDQGSSSDSKTVQLVSSHLVNKPVSPGQGATDHAGSVTDDADDPTTDSEDLAVDADSKTYDAEFPIANAGSV